MKQFVQFINQQNVVKNGKHLKYVHIFYIIRQYEIYCNVRVVHISENLQNNIYNLQIRLEQYSDKKKSWN